VRGLPDGDDPGLAEHQNIAVIPPAAGG